MPKGTYRVESFEPYTLRYLKVAVLEGNCEVSNPLLREYKNSDVKIAQFNAGNAALNRLFEAGRETFCQNAPWTSSWTVLPANAPAGCATVSSRPAWRPNLSGNTRIEHNFFENFLLPASFAHLPKGMLPMCYPADHYDGVFIPNWALWFVVQLGEYKERGGRPRDHRRTQTQGARPVRLFRQVQE